MSYLVGEFLYAVVIKVFNSVFNKYFTHIESTFETQET